MLRRLRALTVLLSLSVAACGTSTPTDPPDNNGGTTSTGSLEVTVNGLDAGVDAALTVTGPGGFSQTVTAAGTLTALATGSYTVAAAGVTGGATAYEPAQSSQTVTVQADQSTLVVVDYVAQLGGLDVLISGLPPGATADVEVTGPGGYTESLQASTTVTDLPVGDYTVTAAAVTSGGGDAYQPSPATQTVSVPFGQAPEAPVEYMLSGTSLQVVVAGLPGGVDAAIEVTGPGGYSANVTATQTLAGLAPGDYAIQATAVTDGPTTYVPDPFAGTVVPINGGDHESSQVTYAVLTLLGSHDLLRIGQNHGCGIDAVGAVNCWGTSLQGELGTGLESDQELNPVGVAAGPYAQVVASSGLSCARTSGGQVDCWGSNLYGETGTGAALGPAADPVLNPTSVAGGHSFARISASPEGNHICGLDQAGAAWCWGRNQGGQLGDGTTMDRNQPVAVAGGHTFVEIDAGQGSTCALKADGKAWCWGDNAFGQLGVSNGVLLGSSTPVEMSTDITFATLGVGGDPCALTAGGQIWCWSDQFVLGSSSHVPTLMADGRPFVQLVKGVQHVCGLEPGGAAWCWGYNSNGQLGDGTADSRITPAPVNGGHVFQALAAGGRNTCGIDTSGTRWCWGNNRDGQLGIGMVSDPGALAPIQIGSF